MHDQSGPQTYFDMGRFDESAAMLEKSVLAKRRVFGKPHPWTQRSAMNGLAEAYNARWGDRKMRALVAQELLDLRSASAESPPPMPTLSTTPPGIYSTHSTKEAARPGAGAWAMPTAHCALEEAAGGARLWAYLDTLALAQHLTGDTATAIETQTRAISLMPSEDADPEMAKRLAEYETALAD